MKLFFLKQIKYLFSGQHRRWLLKSERNPPLWFLLIHTGLHHHHWHRLIHTRLIHVSIHVSYTSYTYMSSSPSLLPSTSPTVLRLRTCIIYIQVHCMNIIQVLQDLNVFISIIGAFIHSHLGNLNAKRPKKFKQQIS